MLRSTPSRDRTKLLLAVHRWILGIALTIVALTCSNCPGDDAALPAKAGTQLVARNNVHARFDSVLSYPLAGRGSTPQERAAHARRFAVVELIDGVERPVPSVVDPRSAASIWWRAPGEFPANSTRTFRVVEHVESLDQRAVTLPSSFAWTISDQAIALLRSPGKNSPPSKLNDSTTPWLQYNVAHVVPPGHIPAVYGRSAYLHPLRTPSGRIVTDEFPPDHAHQSGVFLAYTKTRFEGREPNFWELANKRGRVRCKSIVDSFTANPMWVEFTVEQEHVDETVPGETGKVALLETWTLRAWTPSQPQPDHWIFDIETRRRCATNQPLELPQYHYGGMAIRGAREWGGDRGHFVTSEGKDRIAGNHTRPRWCDLSGLVDGKMAGIALLTHPTNFRYPEPLRIHPSMPYMVYTPSHLGDWKIGPDSSHVSRYRFIIHDALKSVDTIERAWQDFAVSVDVVAQ